MPSMSASESSRAWNALPSLVFDIYDELLVPLLFQAYADYVAGLLTDLRSGSLLEVAAGTGAVTRAMAAALPAEVTITATDLVPGMLERAQRSGTPRPVTWHRADVMALPYESESFDVVVCQFGAMFFEPKAAAFAEVRRVLRPGGRFVFSVWDGLDRNEFGEVVNDAMKRLFPEDPPLFLETKPYAYHDGPAIIADLRAGGFDSQPSIERVEYASHASSPMDVAIGFCGGTPLRDQVEARGSDLLHGAISAASDAIAERFGPEGLQSRMSAQVVVAVK
jgi:SAM-dependent methyltransferase